jgi:hypothetical protein
VSGEAAFAVLLILAEERSVTTNLLRGIILAPTILLATALPGCDNNVPKTYPVTGKVFHKGGKPVTYGRVEFQSTLDPELRATGGIQTDGTFALTTYVGGKSAPGAVAGQHKVLIELESRSAFMILSAPYTVKPEKNEFTFVIAHRR